ncbi:ArsR family transcriptional regulator [Methylopila sp. Yamaguchi]|uniref:ArsR family transcriptional regulator n=1 Tax=Methylopila sp. Yamaguchi TaxID=1437817 RepID=UPI000CC633B9|nr:hypothetical protein METY_1755 [Methylopila sp. Yamaguchi]
MVTEREFKRFSEEMLMTMRHKTMIVGLLKKDSGRLTEAGIAIIREAHKAGYKNSEIAEMLDIAPSAVSYHLK